MPATGLFFFAVSLPSAEEKMLTARLIFFCHPPLKDHSLTRCLSSAFPRLVCASGLSDLPSLASGDAETACIGCVGMARVTQGCWSVTSASFPNHAAVVLQPHRQYHGTSAPQLYHLSIAIFSSASLARCISHP